MNILASAMSISAPALGSYEVPPPSLRTAVSSSEIMYELAVSRFNNETDGKEVDDDFRRRYGLDDSSTSTNDLHRIVDDMNGIKKRDDRFVERFEILERSIVNYNRRVEFDELKKELDERNDIPVVAGVFTPIAVQLPVREFPEMVPTPSSLGPPSLVTIDEETVKDDDFSSNRTEVTTTEIKRVVVQEIPERKSSNTNCSFPKPILKIRKEPNDSESSIKRVRIEEPLIQNDDDSFRKLYIDDEENDDEDSGSDDLHRVDDEVANYNRIVEPEMTSESDERPTLRKLLIRYSLDLFLFLIAVWLYYYELPRLALPILILTVYRRTNEPLRSQITAFRRLGKKPD